MIKTFSEAIERNSGLQIEPVRKCNKRYRKKGFKEIEEEKMKRVLDRKLDRK